jgi:hypothetical protein
MKRRVKRARLARKKPLRQAEQLELAPRSDEPRTRQQLIVPWMRDESWYIVVNKYGYGMDKDIEKAILSAQDNVPLKDKPSQQCIYVSPEPIKPTGVDQWENGAKPRLVGLTNTHQVWIRNPNKYETTR